MSALVAGILEQAETNLEEITVEKPIELEFDIGNLLANDSNEVDMKEYRSSKEHFLHNLARDNTQLLVNQIWGLPTEEIEENTVAVLPPPSFILPREKRIPKPKPETRFEEFAKRKGMRIRKKDKLVWDEEVKDWVPRYGFKRAEIEKRKSWVVEVPGNADPYKDPFAEMEEQKKERIAKNEYQRMRNLLRERKIKSPGVGITPEEKPRAKQLGEAITLAKSSTASLGNYQAKLPKEKPFKMRVTKRQFDPLVISPEEEKRKSLEILRKINTKKPNLDIEKSVGKQIYKEDIRRAQQKKAKKRGHRAGKGKGGKRSLGTFNTDSNKKGKRESKPKQKPRRKGKK